MAKRDGWAYASDVRSETYKGPFPTREEAVHEGLASYEDSDSIVVAEAIYPNPGLEITARFSLSVILEGLEEIAEDGEYWSGDEPLFRIKGNPDAAKAALAVALGSWADQYLEPQSFTARNPEAVERPKAEDAHCGD